MEMKGTTPVPFAIIIKGVDLVIQFSLLKLITLFTAEKWTFKAVEIGFYFSMRCFKNDVQKPSSLRSDLYFGKRWTVKQILKFLLFSKCLPVSS